MTVDSNISETAYSKLILLGLFLLSASSVVIMLLDCPNVVKKEIMSYGVVVCAIIYMLFRVKRGCFKTAYELYKESRDLDDLYAWAAITYEDLHPDYDNHDFFR